jgi:hypothetical protein
LSEINRRNKMGWFTALKGAYPALQQVDKSLPVAAGETGIVRGSCIYESAGEFKLATAAVNANPAAYVYICLIPQDDFTAGMAGTVGQGPAGGKPVITGLAVGMPMEFESSEFDSTQVYSVGDLLTVGNGGLLTVWASGKNVVAQVTKAVAYRWVNDAVGVTGRRTGANVGVLTARTLWVPNLA